MAKKRTEKQEQALAKGQVNTRKPAARAKASKTWQDKRQAAQQAFLAAYELAGTITDAAKAASVQRTSHYDWLAQDPKYPALFEQAHEIFCDSLQAEAVRRGRDGVRRYKFHQGTPILDPVTGDFYCENDYSDPMLMKLLQANLPDKYSDRQRVSHETALTDVPVGPGTPAEAFHAFMEMLKKAHMNEVRVTEVTTMSIAQRAEEIKARRAAAKREVEAEPDAPPIE